MKKITTIVVLFVAMLSACGSSDKKKEADGANDTTLMPEAATEKIPDPIVGKLALVGPAKLGQPINIKFSVYNNSDTVAKFCKWHTPFEKLLSKYLDVALEDYTEVQYHGAMAKRVMPPPADSYTSLKKGDSTSVNFNLMDGYPISKAGVYTIKYNATNVSGIVVPDSLKIKVEN